MVQLQVLNKILSDKDSSIITLNNLNVDYFSEYPEEFNFILNHIEKYGCVPDKTSFLDKFPNFEVINVTEDKKYLMGVLLNDKNTRYIAANYNDIRHNIIENKPEEAMRLIKEAAEHLSSAINLECVDILKDTSRYDAYLDKTKNYDKYFIKTGFKELDSLIGGWDVNEELGVIVARTGIGKSWLLLKFAIAAAMQGKAVGIYSGEMSENKVGYRIDTLLGHISNGAIIHGNESIKNEYKNYIENLQKTVPGSIKVLTPKSINGNPGVSALRAFIEQEHLDILFIDQNSLLEDDRKAKNPVEKAANISKDLKLLQTLKRMPIICISQQNREKIDDKEKKTFDTSQLAQSDRIGQDATLIIFIEREDDLFRLHLVKSRDSENGKVLTYKVDLNRGNFTYIPCEDINEAASDDSDTNSSTYSDDEVF